MPFTIQTTKLAARVGIALDRSDNSIVDLLRAIREAVESMPTVADADLKRFSARPGPGGGLSVNPRLVAYILIGFLVDRPRAEVFDQMCHTVRAASSQRCPLTGAKTFGDAVEKILTDRDLLIRVNSVEVAQHFARINFGDDKGYEDVSYFKPKSAKAPKGAFRIMAIHMGTLLMLSEIIKMADEEDSSSRDIETSETSKSKSKSTA